MAANPGRAAKNTRLSERRDFLVRVRCCRVRHYRVDDLIAVHGDIPVMAMEGHLVCEDCGRHDLVNARLMLPSGQERASIVVRRLVEIRTIRRPVWRDERQ